MVQLSRVNCGQWKGCFTGVGGIIVWYPAHLYSQVLMPAAIQQFSTSIQHFFDQKSCLWAALIYPLPIFHFPNPFQTLTQLCHRIEPVFAITMVLHSTLYLFWKPRYGSCRFFVYAFFLTTYNTCADSQGSLRKNA